MSNKRTLLTLVLMILAMNLILGIRWMIAARSTPSSSACINNLRQVDAAEQQWALENHKTTNDVPTWDELRPYLSRQFVCPQGGGYSLPHVGGLPTCSIGGPTHSLPAN
jgi:hypothetical protein